MEITFEEEYMFVLQNIELSLLSMLEDHPELCDHDLLRVVEHTLSYYKSQQRDNFAALQRRLNQPLQDLFSRVTVMCDWRLGLRPAPDLNMDCTPISREELVLCLKRIEKSIKFWTKQGGRKGYITFVAPRVQNIFILD